MQAFFKATIRWASFAIVALNSLPGRRQSSFAVARESRWSWPNPSSTTFPPRCTSRPYSYFMSMLAASGPSPIRSNAWPRGLCARVVGPTSGQNKQRSCASAALICNPRLCIKRCLEPYTSRKKRGVRAGPRFQTPFLCKAASPLISDQAYPLLTLDAAAPSRPARCCTYPLQG